MLMRKTKVWHHARPICNDSIWIIWRIFGQLCCCGTFLLCHRNSLVALNVLFPSRLFWSLPLHVADDVSDVCRCCNNYKARQSVNWVGALCNLYFRIGLNAYRNQEIECTVHTQPNVYATSKPYVKCKLERKANALGLFWTLNKKPFF